MQQDNLTLLMRQNDAEVWYLIFTMAGVTFLDRFRVLGRVCKFFHELLLDTRVWDTVMYWNHRYRYGSSWCLRQAGLH